MQVISREEVFERLDHLLKTFVVYCRDETEFPEFIWPPGELLGRIDECVMFLIGLERRNTVWPFWKAFEMIDRRRRPLRLVPRINSLAKRAIGRRKEKCGESVLEKAVRQPDSLETQILLRNLVQHNEEFVRVFKEHDSRVRERMESRPLLEWLCAMSHPDAQNLILPSLESLHLPELLPRIMELAENSRKRDKNRERQERHRQRKNSLPEKRY